MASSLSSLLSLSSRRPISLGFAIAIASAGVLHLIACGDELPSDDPSPADSGGLDGGGESSIGTSDSEPDEVIPDGGCSAIAPFKGSRQLVTISTASEESSMTLSPDEKDIIFSSRGDFGFTTNGMAHLYGAHRDDPTLDFGPPTLIEELFVGGASAETAPAFAENGQTLYYALAATQGSDLNILRAFRASPGGEWSMFEGVPNVNTEFVDTMPNLTSKSDELFFTTNASGRYTLQRAMIADGGSVQLPIERLTELESPTGNVNLQTPVISHDGLTLYFSTLELENTVVRVWRARRASPTDPFGKVAPVDEVNAQGSTTRPGWISPDNCRLYVTQSRGSAPIDIYMFDRR